MASAISPYWLRRLPSCTSFVRVFQSLVMAISQTKSPATDEVPGRCPDLFSGLFNVARNPVTKRHGGKTYSKPEADRALALTVDFFKKHLG